MTTRRWNDQVVSAHLAADLVQQAGHVLGLDAQQDRVGMSDGLQIAAGWVHAEVTR